MVRRLNYQLPVDANAKSVDNSYEDMAIRMQFNASGNVVYVGKAEAGTLSASSCWQIRKIQYDSSGTDNISSIIWVSGGMDYDQIWDNRAGLVYL